MNNWDIAAIAYGAIALLTFLPVLVPMLRGAKLYPSGVSFEESAHFSGEAKKHLSDHYSRIVGTLGFWKKQATVYKRFHYYSVCWTLISSWLVPLLGTIGVQGEQRWLIVAVSSHVALALSFHRGLRVPDMLRAFCLGESNFCDLHRRLLDRPLKFGETEAEQLDAYFAAVEDVRKFVRSAEADSMPTIEQGLHRPPGVTNSIPLGSLSDRRA
jgi:hypothetical protein